MLIPPENVKVMAVQIELYVAENVTDESKEEEAKCNYMFKYAQLKSKRVYKISSIVSCNPH